MAIYKNSPPIVTNGLFAYFDPASTISPAIKNQFLFTNTLNNSTEWSLISSSITPNVGIAPDGTNTAFLWTSIGSGDQLVRITAANHRGFSMISGSNVTLSIHVKSSSFQGRIELGVYNFGQTLGTEPGFNISQSFRLATGTSGPGVRGLNTRIDELSDGWFRIQQSFNVTSSISRYANFFDLSSTVQNPLESGSSILLWGPQFEYGTVASPYQEIGSDRIWNPIIRSNNLVSASLSRSVVYQPDNKGIYTFTDTTSNLNISNCDYASTTSSSFSIGLWFKRNNLPPRNFSTIYLQGNGGSTNARIWLILDNNNTGSLEINYFTTSGVLDRYITLHPNLNHLNWNYVVQVIDKESLTMRGYYNGMLVGIGNIAPSSGSFTSDNILRFNSSGIRSSEVSIGNIQIYNKALTDSEVFQNFNSLKNRYGI